MDKCPRRHAETTTTSVLMRNAKSSTDTVANKPAPVSKRYGNAAHVTSAQAQACFRSRTERPSAISRSRARCDLAQHVTVAVGHRTDIERRREPGPR